jgi:hypothetical protein
MRQCPKHKVNLILDLLIDLANFTVSEVGVIVNSKLKKNYTTKRMEINSKHKEEMKEEWGFHGTSRESINKIAQTGFLHPDELKALQAKNNNKKKGKVTKPKHEKPVELLDDGYYGKGIYFTTFSDYAYVLILYCCSFIRLWYSEERESDQVLLCKLLTGKTYKCTKRYVVQMTQLLTCLVWMDRTARRVMIATYHQKEMK